MELTQKNIYEQLKTVIDPETGIDLVGMGLFYDVRVVESKVRIKMTLTSPGCPLVDLFLDQIRESLSVFAGLNTGRDVDIEITFDPPWVPDMMSEEAKAELGID
jgi:metal-sulfur cluster biosynthetic enzyme